MVPNVLCSAQAMQSSHHCMWGQASLCFTQTNQDCCHSPARLSISTFSNPCLLSRDKELQLQQHRWWEKNKQQHPHEKQFYFEKEGRTIYPDVDVEPVNVSTVHVIPEGEAVRRACWDCLGDQSRCVVAHSWSWCFNVHVPSTGWNHNHKTLALFVAETKATGTRDKPKVEDYQNWNRCVCVI